MQKRKMPRDANQRAFLTMQMSLGEADAEPTPEHVKDPAAVELGRRGGLKGGKARAASMTPEERSEIARKGAAARWSKP
jgi:hypothetical protein